MDENCIFWAIHGRNECFSWYSRTKFTYFYTFCRWNFVLCAIHRLNCFCTIHGSWMVYICLLKFAFYVRYFHEICFFYVVLCCVLSAFNVNLTWSTKFTIFCSLIMKFVMLNWHWQNLPFYLQTSDEIHDFCFPVINRLNSWFFLQSINKIFIFLLIDKIYNFSVSDQRNLQFFWALTKFIIFQTRSTKFEFSVSNQWNS